MNSRVEAGEKWEDLTRLLQCPDCGIPLDARAKCGQCGKEYLNETGTCNFLSADLSNQAKQEQLSDNENAVKNFFKRWPRFYRHLSFFIAPVLMTGLTIEKFAAEFNGGLVLNVGSGATNIIPGIVNVDLFPFKNVDVLAAADNLPFISDSFEAACCDQVLEHVINPRGTIAELVRVVKPGGKIYVGVPFIYPWHPSPSDYARYSREGLAEMFGGCEITSSGVAFGPTSALLLCLCSWLSIVFSFGSSSLRKILNYAFFIPCFPFKFLDLIMARLPGAEVSAAAIYVVAKKVVK